MSSVDLFKTEDLLKTDLHTHTVFCDGACSPNELLEKAVSLNLKRLGILVHSYTFFDESYCVKKEKVKEFQNLITDLKEKYKGKLEVLCGVEQDYYSTFSTDGFDYVIGSVHYLFKDGEYLPVDENEEITRRNIFEFFNGDPYAYAEEYFRVVSGVVEKTGADVIGHFDIVAKENAGGLFIDTNNIRYQKAYKDAIKALVKCDKPFEINTSRIFKGLSKNPYPELTIIDEIKKLGGKFILSSDAHATNAVAFKFNEIYSLIK